jgi:hypothetical protein
MNSQKMIRFIVEEFESGMTSTQIASGLYCSRQKVCNILRQEGVSRWQGGAHMRRLKREERRALAKLKDREERIERNYKCSVAEYDFIMQHDTSISKFVTLNEAYLGHKRGARIRGIGFNFTFPQWFKIWNDSGKINKRGGNRSRSYVMARKGDKGPYSIRNVDIKTSRANIQEGHKFRKVK